MSAGLLSTAIGLAADAVGAEVVEAWRTEGIEPILLKGPTVADWLYPNDARPYGDIDLLVAPAQVMDAAAVLARLGFTPVDHHVSLHAHPWVREADQAAVDLHVRLWGLHYPAERVWRELCRWVEVSELASIPVRTLRIPARALSVVLHAAQHAGEEKPLEDLRRALRRTPDHTWREAERLADRIGGLKAMAEGLALDAEGAALINRLALVRAAAIADPEHAPLAIGFARFSAARGVRGKLRVVIAAVGRPRELIGPEADRTGSGQVLSRFWHVLTLLVRAPRTMIALRRAHGSDLIGAPGPPSLPLAGKALLASEILRAYAQVRLTMHRYELPRAVASLRATRRSDRVRQLPDPAGDGERLGAAVLRTLRPVPGNTRCLMSSLVLLRLLADRGAEGSLVISARPDEDAGLVAHAWVEFGGRPLLPPSGPDHGRLVTL